MTSKTAPDTRVHAPLQNGTTKNGATAPAQSARPMARVRGALDSDERQPAASKARERRYRRLLAGGDLVATVVALLVAGPIVGDHLESLAFLTPLLLLFAAKVVGLYDQDELRLKKSTLDEVPALFSVATLTAFCFWLVHPNLVDGAVGRDQVVALWLALLGSLVVMRLSSRRLARALSGPERCLVVGPPATRRAAAGKLENSPGVSAECVAHAEIDDIVNRPGRVSDALAELAARDQVERVVIAAREADGEDVLDIVRAAKLHGLRVTMVPRMVEAIGSSIVFDDIDGTLMLGVRRFGLTRSSRAFKRAFDVLGSGIGLLVLAPAGAMIAIAIKLDSRGPVLFRQPRVGRHGETFLMHKFRTMDEDADQRKAALRERNEAEGLFKIAKDPRITRLGGLLRSSALDELPQLWDVLCGRMSLVGPRPLVIEETEQIGGWHRRRLELAPGMTGRWQVLGGVRSPLEEMNQLDYLYAANWSLWADVKILLRTIPVVIGRQGL